MTTDPQTTPDSTSGAARAWIRPAALVLACLVIGFIAGWVLRGDDGPVTVLAPETPAAEGQPGATTVGRTVTAPTTSTPARPPAPPDRADIAVAVLNGTNTQGLAAETAGEAESLGYNGVTAGNAPTTTGPSAVYFRSGDRPAAVRVAKDLQIQQVVALPASGALADAAPDEAEVVVVLGSG
jgi:hypothetical protein